MIPKRSRLAISSFPRSAPFLWRGSALSVKMQKNGLDRSRFGVIIPAAAVPSAVKRHVLKRRALALGQKLPVRGLDLLLIFKKDIGWEELKAEFDKIKSKLR